MKHIVVFILQGENIEGQEAGPRSHKCVSEKAPHSLSFIWHIDAAKRAQDVLKKTPDSDCWLGKAPQDSNPRAEILTLQL